MLFEWLLKKCPIANKINIIGFYISEGSEKNVRNYDCRWVIYFGSFNLCKVSLKKLKDCFLR